MLMNRLEVGTDHRLKLEGTKSTRELNRRAVPASKRWQSTFQSAQDLGDKNLMLMNRLEVGTAHRLKLEGTKSTRELNRRAVPASKRSQSTFQSAEDLEDKIKPSVVSGQ